MSYNPVGEQSLGYQHLGGERSGRQFCYPSETHMGIATPVGFFNMAVPMLTTYINSGLHLLPKLDILEKQQSLQSAPTQNSRQPVY